MCPASCFWSSVATARFFRLIPETTRLFPSVTVRDARISFSGKAISWTPPPPFGRSGTSSSGNTSSRASEESAATNFPSENFTGGRACAPSSAFMKSFPCRVLVTRSPSLHTKPRPAELRSLYQGPSIVAILLRIFLQFGDNQFLQFLVVAEQRLQSLALGLKPFLLVVQLDAVEPGEL